MTETQKIIYSLKSKVAILRKFASDRLGEGYWGLDKDSDEKFTHEEILFLFARIFHAIGFDAIKKVRTTFPDVIATEDGVDKGIELEPLLSSFKRHLKARDDLSLCDYIVCWKNDLPRRDELHKTLTNNNIEVIELIKFYELTKVTRKITKLVFERKDIEKLTDGQLRVLRVFIQDDKDIISKDEMQKRLGKPGKVIGPWIGGLTRSAKSKLWLVRETPRGYQYNKKYKRLVKEVLKEFDYI
jgi:hypothetical protein